MKSIHIGVVVLSTWLVLSIAAVPRVWGQGWEWAKYANSSNTDEAASIAVDKKTGEVYVVGSSLGALSELGLPNLGSDDGFLAKYKANGTLIWALPVAGTGSDKLLAVDVDSVNHRVYVAGFVSGTVTINGRGGTPFSGTANGTQDVVVAAFDSSGAVLWALLEGGPSVEFATGVAMDNNAVYVSGNYQGTADFDGAGGPVTTIMATGTQDWWVAKYRKSNGALFWVRENKQGGAIQRSQAIAVDSNAVYVCGGFSSPSIRALGVSGNVNVVQIGAGGTDAFMFSLRRSDGLAFWGYAAGAAGVSDEATGIATDGNGVYLGGRVGGSPTFPPLAAMTTGSSTDGFLSKHSSVNGNAQWVNIMGNIGGVVLEGVSDVRVDETGSPWVGGFFGGTLSLPNVVAPTTSLTSVGGNDMFLASFRSNGSLNFAVQGGGSGNDGAAAISVWNKDNAYATGNYSMANSAFSTVPSTTLPLEGAEDIYVARYSLCNQHPNLALTVSGTSANICVGDSGLITVNASEVGTNYELIDSATGSVIGTAQGGNGGAILFSTGPLLTTTTFAIQAYIGSPNCAERLPTNLPFIVSPNPTVNIGPDIDQCGGFGPILDAGPGFASYLWSTFQPSSSIVATSSGTYSVTVTDANGCQASDTMVFNLFTLPTPDLGSDTTVCAGSTMLLDAGSGYASYAWNTGQTSQTLLVAPPGMWSVTVTDANGCTGSDMIDISTFALPTPDLGNDTTICMGANLILSTALAYNGYAWSTGSNASTITVSAQGSYKVTVTDGNQCMGADTIFVTQMAVSVPLIGNDTNLCQGASLLLDAGPGYTSYAWSTSASTQSIMVNATGTYTVTVTDGSGCDATSTINVAVHPLPTPNLGNDTTICMGSTVTLDPGAGYVSYSWSSFDVTPTILVSTAGTWSVTVMDTNGCTASDQINVALAALPTPFLGNDTSICMGKFVVLNPGAYTTYAWSTGASSPTISAFTTCLVEVTVTNASGCAGTDQINISVLALPTPFLGNDTGICTGASLILNPGAYASYAWSTGPSTPTISASTAGSYTVTVTDGNGCDASDQINIALFATPTPFLGNDTSICPFSSLVLNPGAGYAGYAWSTGASTNTIVVSTSVTVDVTVTDSNGCQGSDQISIALLPSPTPSLGNDTSLCMGKIVLLDPGAGYNAYVWNTGAVTPTITSTGGTVIVTVTGSNGCTNADTIVVGNYAVPVLNLPNAASICTGDSLTLDPGIVANSCLWSTGQSGPTIQVNAGGVYYVDVMDTHGCMGSDTTLVTISNPPTVVLGNDTSMCMGSGTLTLDAGNTGAQYLWSTGDTLQTLVVTVGATYSVTVTNGQGCSAIDSIVVNLFPSPIVNLGNDLRICERSNLVLVAGSGWQDVMWSSGDTTGSITVSTAGLYWVQVTDSNGCLGRDSLNLTVQPLPDPQLGADTTICDGTFLRLSTQLSGDYLWSTGDTTSTIVVTSDGVYVLTVRDGTCAGSDTIVVSEQAGPLVDVGPDLSLCPGDTATLTSSWTGACLWSTGSVSHTIVVQNAGLYWLQVTDSMGCNGRDSMVLAFVSPVAVSFADLQPAYCQSDPATQLVGTPAGGIFTGGNTANGLFDPAIAGLGNIVINYAFTDSIGCSWQAMDSTTVTEPPSPADAGMDQVALSPVTLQAVAPLVGQGHWELGSLNAIISDPLDPNAVLTTEETGRFPLVWVVENSPCAPERDTMFVQLEGLFMPTGFSPNTDGTNDNYVIRGIDNYPDGKLSIFNRWGNLVWKSEHYHNEWIGTNMQSQPLVDDTYYAILEFNGKTLNTYIVLARGGG